RTQETPRPRPATRASATRPEMGPMPRCVLSVLYSASLLGGLTLGGRLTAADEKPDAAQLEFFEKQVRPLLAENCFQCHGPEKQKGGLRLDSRTAVLNGGDS